MDDGASDATEIHSRDHQARHDLDTEIDDASRVRARAREDADGTLARLWTRLKRALGRN